MMFVHMYPYDHRRVSQKIIDFFHSEPPSQFPFVMFRTSPHEKNRDCTSIGYAIIRNIEDVQNHIFTTPTVVIMSTKRVSMAGIAAAAALLAMLLKGIGVGGGRSRGGG